MVTLIDGRQVDSASEDWRHECEARAVAMIPTIEGRRRALAKVERHRGAEARERIQKTILAMWERIKEAATRDVA